jgi:hypothetical protein
MEGWRKKGWFDASCFRADGPNVRAAVRVISELRDLGTDVVVVLVPESTRLRIVVPPEASESLTNALS